MAPPGFLISRLGIQSTASDERVHGLICLRVSDLPMSQSRRSSLSFRDTIDISRDHSQRTSMVRNLPDGPSLPVRTLDHSDDQIIPLITSKSPTSTLSTLHPSYTADIALSLLFQTFLNFKNGIFKSSSHRLHSPFPSSAIAISSFSTWPTAISRRIKYHRAGICSA